VKNNLMTLVRWFCRHLTFNDLASVVPILQEVLSGSRHIELKPAEDRPPHYRQFRVDTTLPLTEAPETKPDLPDWQQIQKQHELQHGKCIAVVQRRKGAAIPPAKCRCQHCNAPARYLYMNNGKRSSQVLCKICGETSPTHRCQRESKTHYWCPHCGAAMFQWKDDGICTAFKCPNLKCEFYLRNLAALTTEERDMRAAGKTSQFKLHYLFREYHYASEDLVVARPEQSPVDLNRIHNNLNTVGLCLTFSISFAMSARMTAEALKRLYCISISHQTVINYINAAASQLTGFVDANMPVPQGPCAADETYITVEGITHYTWLIIEKIRRAICGYNLSNNRGTQPALALLHSACGTPEKPKCDNIEIVTDGLSSYNSAIVAYNTEAQKHHNHDLLTKRTVIGLQNLDNESEEFRPFKQLIERLNRTYKFHARPRAGFKNFDGVVALTTLFVAFYNHMRPHAHLKGNVPVPLQCLQGETLYPKMWVEMLRQAA
jgi:putative transposase